MLINILIFVNNIVFSVLSVSIIKMMIDKTKKYDIKIFLLQCFTLLYLMVIDIYVNDIIRIICITIIFVIDVFVISRKSLIDCISYAILAALVVCISDEFSSVMTEAVIDVGDIYVNIAPWLYILKCLLCYMIIYSVVTIINLKKLKIFEIGNVSVKTKIMICVVILLQIVTIITQYFITLSFTYIKDVRCYSLISYFSTFFTILAFYYVITLLIEKDNTIEKNDEINMKMKTVNDILKFSFESQRKINHEHGNNLAVLSGYIENKNYDKAVEYIGKIIGIHRGNLNEHISNIKESGFRSLLSYKYSLIKCRDIDCEIVIDENICNTIIPSEDLSTILAIFLDNAIDAASESDDPFISITILKSLSEGEHEVLDIIIENSTKCSKIDRKKIFESGYSTKGQGRGYGLNIVKELINFYNELELKTEVNEEDLTFIQKLRVMEIKKPDAVDIL